jgi:hypothetical protein
MGLLGELGEQRIERFYELVCAIKAFLYVKFSSYNTSTGREVVERLY